MFKTFSDNNTGFVTRIKDHAVYETIHLNSIPDNIHSGVLSDTIIEVEVKKVVFYDRILGRNFEFLTNLFDMRADLIAGFYKLRWQIETLFKRLKQNF
jgi:IS4 transposase